MREYLARNPDQRAKSRNRHSTAVRHWRTEAVGLLGGVCVKCGFSDARALQIDHVNGDGYADRRSSPGRKSCNTYVYYKRIVEQPESRERYQILCANCNWIKKHDNKETGSGNRFSYEERKTRKAEAHAAAEERLKPLALNRRPRRGPTNGFGYRGVSKRNASKWAAQIGCGGVTHHLGTYESVEDAARAYDKAAIELHGEFARLNFPNNPNS